MLVNTVGITAGKGGVLKTTLACHLSGLAAHAGWQVLLVDADPQGNAMFDLGYRSDGGENLAAAISGTADLRPLGDVRDRLDVAPGGPFLDGLPRSDDPEHWWRLNSALEPLAGRYDLVVIDSPARELHLRRQILTAARCVVIPTGVDRASRVGLPDAAASINEVRSVTNPRLDVLAVVAGPIAQTHTRIRERTRARLGELIGDPALVAATTVRFAPLAAERCREHGMLTTEYAEMGDPRHRASTGSATGIARDWTCLVAELLDRYRALVRRQ